MFQRHFANDESPDGESDAQKTDKPELPGQASANLVLGSRGDKEKFDIGRMGNLRRHDVFAFSSVSYHVKLGVPRNAFHETAAVIRNRQR